MDHILIWETTIILLISVLRNMPQYPIVFLRPKLSSSTVLFTGNGPVLVTVYLKPLMTHVYQVLGALSNLKILTLTDLLAP